MSIKRFNYKTHRHYSVKNTVSYKNVPVPRGVAYALDLVDRRGADFQLFSCIRVDSILKQHNKDFGTNLHGQQYLYDNQNRPGFNPANPPSKTSHCWFSDGNPVYRTAAGRRAGPGERIVWHQIGIDASNADQIIRVGKTVGLDFVRPYSSGSEAHHLVLRTSPVKLLERMGTISKIRA